MSKQIKNATLLHDMEDQGLLTQEVTAVEDAHLPVAPLFSHVQDVLFSKRH